MTATNREHNTNPNCADPEPNFAPLGGEVSTSNPTFRRAWFAESSRA